MPGRQYSAQAPNKVQPKRKRKQQKRLLDAFSIAQHENPEKFKIRRHRLGEVEQAPTKRRRDDSEEEADESGDEDEQRHKRSRRDGENDMGESGSDGEGNRWVTGRVASDDESSLDSDEAFGDSDEEGPSSKRKQNGHVSQGRKSGTNGLMDEDGADIDIDLDEDEEMSDSAVDSDDESEGFAADAMDLADVLDQRDSESEDEDQETTQQIKKRSLAYGSNDSEDEERSELSLSEDEADESDKSKLRALKDLVTSLDPAKENARPRIAAPDAQETMAPSEYGVVPTQKLTIADLLPTVTDPKLRKSLRAIASDGKGSKSGGVPQKLDVPLAKRQQDRIDRSVAFEKSKEALSRWIDTIKHNRRAEHLQFPLMDPDAASAKNASRLQLTTQSKPMTDLESTIQDILFESGLVSHDAKAEEDQIQTYEELATNKMPLEEAQARQAELRKHRALLFKEEIKAKRIKKIKSKAYRRVHRKEKERNALREHQALAEAGIELSEDEQERMHRQRAEERMGARHRESKWAKAVKQTGRGAWDDDARAGVTDMARRDEELRKRQLGKDVHSNDIDSDSETSEDDDNESDDEKFASKMRDKLEGLEDKSSASKGLSSLAFMQKAEAARKARNDEDVLRLKRELNGEETPQEDSDAEEPSGRRSYGPVQTTTPQVMKRTKQRNEFEEGSGSEGEEHNQHEEDDPESAIQGEGSTVTKRQTTSKRGPLSKTPAKTTDTAVNPFSMESQDTATPTNPFLVPSKKHSKRGTAAPDAVTIDLDESDSAEDSSSTKASAKPSKALVTTTTNHPKSRSKHQTSTKDNIDDDTSSSGSDADSDAPAPASNPLTTNKALISQAFAGDGTAATSFAAEKAQLSKLEAPQDQTPAALPGWGSWTGDGLTKATRRANERRAVGHRAWLEASGLANGGSKKSGIEADRRKDRKLDKVIVSEKRVGKNAKYLAGALPLGFETKEQYERSLRVPVGPEWSTKETFQSATKPRVLVKGGIIGAMRKPLV